MYRRTLICMIVAVMAVSTAGCSDKIKISGRVVFPDGTPLTKGKVCFRPLDQPKVYFGRLDADGRFSPGEFKDGSGLPPGIYDVWISSAEISKEVLDKRGRQTGIFKNTPLVAPIHASQNPRCFKCEVAKNGKRTFDLVVNKP